MHIFTLLYLMKFDYIWYSGTLVMVIQYFGNNLNLSTFFSLIE